jgi:hypothetical protein
MKTTVLLAGILSLGGAAFGADPQLMNLVMPGAKVLAGVNVTNARISPLGLFLISRVQAENKGIQALVTATGFNPLTDVTEVLAAPAGDPASPGGLLLLRGSFKVDQIAAAIAAHQSAGVEVQNRAGATLVTFGGADGKVGSALAFVSDSIAVAGDAPTVLAALDRSSGSNAIDPQLAVKVNALSGNDDAWVVSAAPLAALLPAGAGVQGGPAQALQMLNSVQSFSAAMKLDSNVTLAGEIVASDAKNAQALSDVVRLVVSLAAMNAGKDPVLAQALQLLQKLQVTTDGSNVDLALTIPESSIEQFINTIPATAKLR